MQLPLAVRTALFVGPLLLSTAIADPAPASPAIVADRAKADPGATASGSVPGTSGAHRREQALGSYLAGTVAGHLGDSATAADLLLDALAHDPGEPLLLQPAFLFSALAGRPQAPQLASRVEPSLIAQLVLGNDAAMRGDWDVASREFSTLPPSPLNDAIRPLLLAWAQQGAGHTDLALATLSGVASAGPLASAAALQAAMIADLAGRKEAASNLYRTAQAVFPGANLALVQALGSFLVRNGHAVEAQAMVHDLSQQISVLGMVEPGIVASLGNPVVASPRQGLARAYLAIASILQEQGPGAKEATAFILRFALDLQPDLTAAKLMLAELLAPDHANAAIDALANVGAADPLAPLVDLRTATLLAVTGRRAESRTRLEALVKAYPKRPEPAQSLGDVLSDSKLYGPAVVAYDTAIADRQALTGKALAGNDWQLLFSRAVAFDRQNQWPRAQADLEHALALAPAEPYILNYLGYSLVERHQDLKQARQLIQRALDSKPDDGSIRDSLGWVMLRQDDVPGAVTTLERAAEQIPEDPTVNYHLGAAYWAAGRRVEAEDQWRWALVLHPEPEDAAKIRDALKKADLGLASPEPAVKPHR
ncbi:tetratricopeptide repeat protein [Lichenicola cladoniae]|uniref:Tetratricopeptide repeat protein n=1 Tax=Lichenicola cladoniae TaxID=1484109 RepID=A0A6M8HS35_9PROT|nr:tetratricopeptide repeat protein [Lichenicola cladoniae]NPD65859.1 tetratricopeptide repeat protein [Acetobacteraceae bacterium]QKE91140.1 tetratricopeptide repeat protein [Lichenicola cladoniae]